MTSTEDSASHAALRARITELSVHIPCGRLRGPVAGRWQSCLCEDVPEEWADCDVSREQDLCVICLRATAGGTLRWAWLACDDCRKASNAIARMRDKYPDRPFALTRYSLTNGAAVVGRPVHEEPRQPPAWLQEFTAGDDRVREWGEREYPRLASKFDPQDDIPLRIWQQEWPPGIEASVDALGRLLGHKAPLPDEGSVEPSVRRRQKADDQRAASDVPLRERLTELAVHIPCGGVRGPISGRWQSCPCEDAQEIWEGFDVSHERDLCAVCLRGAAGGTSRWSWLACEDCLAVKDVVRDKTGKRIALGRHSIMNGFCVHAGASPELQREQAGRLAQFVQDQQELFKWQSTEFHRLAVKFPPDADIPLAVWQREFPPALNASIDAMIRLTRDNGFLRALFA